MTKKRGGRRGKATETGVQPVPDEKPKPGPSQAPEIGATSSGGPKPGPSQEPQPRPTAWDSAQTRPKPGPISPSSEQPKPGLSRESQPRPRGKPDSARTRSKPGPISPPSEQPKPGSSRESQPRPAAWGRGKPDFAQTRPRPGPTSPSSEQPRPGPSQAPEAKTWGRGRPDSASAQRGGGKPGFFRPGAEQPRRSGREEQFKAVSPQQPSQGQLVSQAQFDEIEKQVRFKPGTLGRKITIETNHLQLNLGNLKEFYRYDVTIMPEDKPKKMQRMAMELFRKAKFPNNYPSYDGQKLLLSAKQLPFDDVISDKVVFKYDKDADKELTLEITIKPSSSFVVSLEGLRLDNLLQKNCNIFEIMQCLEIVFRQAYVDSFINVGRRFFLPPSQRKFPVGDGAEMYLGGIQAAVQGWTTFLNVDVAHKAFTTSITVIALIQEMFKRPPVREEYLPHWQCDQLNTYLKSLKIRYQLPNYPDSKRTYTVNGLGEPPNKASFSYNNQPITVEAYYRTKWHCTLKYPKLPTLWVGNPKNKVLLPMECCELMPGQPLQGAKMTENQTRGLLRYAATSTTERKNKIKSIIEKAGYNADPRIREFELSVSDEFQKVEGRVLTPPTLQYGKRSEVPANGEWRGSEFVNGTRIRQWTIVGVGVDQGRVSSQVGELAQMFVDFGRKKGMYFPKPSEPFEYIQTINYKSVLECLQKKKNFDLIVVIISSFRKDIYYLVKQAAELNVGCLTQCVKSDTLQKLRPSTINNLLLKINAKTNGTNHVLTDLKLLSAEPVMVMGADVTHPSPQTALHPSVVAVTASDDLSATNYNACIRYQAPRETMSEMIQDLQAITATQLKRFVAKTRAEPKRIYFFRDGVSEGEFERVRRIEIGAIKKACLAYRSGYSPKITFVVVQKRHHTRFFPIDASGSGGDRNFNVPPGTCVDKIITDPANQNFYLTSHASIQGVARPTKYRTLYDDNEMTNDDLEKLVYYLCHVFVRCDRAVSYPAPTYYAHVMAERAKGYLYGKNVNMKDLDPMLIKVKEDFVAKYPMFFP